MASGRIACGVPCWTAMPCPVCGAGLPPRARSVPAEMEQGFKACCREHMRDPANVRHLWDEHDDCRHYTDPEGWREHVKGCERCRRER